MYRKLTKTVQGFSYALNTVSSNINILHNYGTFINTLISFLIVSFAVFLLVKTINKLKAEKPAEPAAPAEPTTKNCPFCCSEINIKATKCPYCASEVQ